MDVYIVGGGPAAAVFDAQFASFFKGKTVKRAATPDEVLVAIRDAAQRPGTRSVVLVGCGGAPGRRVIAGRKGGVVGKATPAWAPGDDWPDVLAAHKADAKAEHGVNVHSLNPFINFAYEGHGFQ